MAWTLTSWINGRSSSMRGVNYLDLVPEHVVEAETSDNADQVVLLMPRYRDFLFRRLVQPLLRVVQPAKHTPAKALEILVAVTFFECRYRRLATVC